jgi:hypothetical protein
MQRAGGQHERITFAAQALEPQEAFFLAEIRVEVEAAFVRSDFPAQRFLPLIRNRGIDVEIEDEVRLRRERVERLHDVLVEPVYL